MVSSQDEQWLRQVLQECFRTKTVDDKKLLENFSMVIRHMVENMQRELNHAQTLWETHPESGLLREKFAMLARCLCYLDKFCRGKIDREGGKR